MASDLLLGIDIGTYESKGVLVRPDGEILALSVRSHELHVPQEGWAEHDAERDWWEALCSLSRDLIVKSGVKSEWIRGVGCSTIGPCVLPVDEEGRPLRNAILYGIDTRATEEIDHLRRLLGSERIFRRCGNDLSAQAAGPKILWIRNQEPELFEKARRFLPGTSFLVGKLTGRFLVDHYTASTYVPFYDLEQRDWAEDLCEEVVGRNQLPQISETTEVAGEVSREAADETGLAPGTPVVVGTVDAAAEAVSVGITKAGRLMLMYGSTAFMILPTLEPRPDPRLWAAPYLFSGLYSVMGGMATTGTLTRWFRDQLARDLVGEEKRGGHSAYRSLAEEAAAVGAGAQGLVALPYFSGERTPLNDPRARGIFFGLSLQHTRGHLYRAVLESTGYGIRHHLEVFAEQGSEVELIRAVGGGVKNPLWLQVVSDICGVQQEVPQTAVGAAYGDAFLAGLGTGQIRSVEAVEEWIEIDRVVSPRQENRSVYDRQYCRFRELYRSTKHLL